MVKAVGSGPAGPTISLIYVLRPPAVSWAKRITSQVSWRDSSENSSGAGTLGQKSPFRALALTDVVLAVETNAKIALIFRG